MKTWHWTILLATGLILERIFAVAMPILSFITPVLIVYWALTSPVHGRQLALMMLAAIIFDIFSGLETSRSTLAIMAVIITALLLRRRISVRRGSFPVIILTGLFCILEFLLISSPFFLFEFYTGRLWYLFLEAGIVFFLVACADLFLTHAPSYHDASR